MIAKIKRPGIILFSIGMMIAEFALASDKQSGQKFSNDIVGKTGFAPAGTTSWRNTDGKKCETFKDWIGNTRYHAEGKIKIIQKLQCPERTYVFAQVIQVHDGKEAYHWINLDDVVIPE